MFSEMLYGAVIICKGCQFMSAPEQRGNIRGTRCSEALIANSSEKWIAEMILVVEDQFCKNKPVIVQVFTHIT